MAKVLLIVYDNGSYIPFFPQGIAYLAGALRKEGHDVELWLQDITHTPDDRLTVFLDDHDFDIVGLGFCAGYYQYKRCLSIAQAVNSSRKRSRFLFILGGHGPAAEPEWFKKKFKANTVVVGEAEKWLLGVKDIDSYPWPAYDLFPIEVYRLIRWPTSTRNDFCMPILSGRGCKWHCSFCYRMDEGFRPRSPKAVLEEIRFLHIFWNITHFQFSDELFMSSKERVHTFCEAILASPLRFKWDCNGRLNYADKETLGIMKRAGCEYINYGIESLDQKLLNEMKKGLTIDQIFKGVENTLAADLTPGLNLIWGFPGDTAENLWKAVRFLGKYDTCKELRTIRPVTPYPGCPLYYQAIKKGKLEGPEDFYERKHINSDLLTVNWTDMSDEQFHQQLCLANKALVRNYHNKQFNATVNDAMKFYQGKNLDFRGFRPI